MRFSDWSSDVCSSDLGPHAPARSVVRPPVSVPSVYALALAADQRRPSGFRSSTDANAPAMPFADEDRTQCRGRAATRQVDQGIFPPLPMKKSAPSKTRTRNPEQTRAKLLQATIDLLADKGADALSLKEAARIAKEIGRAHV